MDDDEEILLELTNVLTNFLPYIGGSNHVMHVLKILENLASVEESVIRTKAVEGIKKIFSTTKIRDFENDIIAMFKRMLSGDGYAAKFSVTYLIPIVFPSMNAAH